MSENQTILFVFLITSLIVYSCARPAMPTGGPDDETPPEVNYSKSTQNFQTNFYPSEIILEFDEFIELKNANQEVIISPPFINYPKYVVRGRKLTITLPEDEALRENTTYQLNFGKSIKDFKAGNEVENLKFVFSTGDIIDSLKISGSAIDAFTGEAIKDAIVMLHENLSDTAIHTVKPFYFARTDDEGNFELTNLRSDTFQLYGLKDDNINYLYDQPTEFIGYIDSLIYLPDSLLGEIKVSLFDEREIPTILRADQKSLNQLKITFTDKPRNINYEIDSLDYDDIEFVDDTLKFWYVTTKDSFDLILNWEEVSDTIRVKNMHRKDGLNKFRCVNDGPVHKHFKKDTVDIEFNYPLSYFEKDSISFIDSLDKMQINYADIDGRRLRLQGLIPDSSEIILVLPKGAVKDFRGRDNDSLEYKVNWKSDEELGNIVITLRNLNPKDQYLCNLMDKNKNIKFSQTIKGDTLLKVNNIEGGKYALEIVEDLNENGFWDTGSLSDRKKAENKMLFDLEELRAGWDLETIIELNPLK